MGELPQALNWNSPLVSQVRDLSRKSRHFTVPQCHRTYATKLHFWHFSETSAEFSWKLPIPLFHFHETPQTSRTFIPQVPQCGLAPSMRYRAFGGPQPRWYSGIEVRWWRVIGGRLRNIARAYSSLLRIASPPFIWVLWALGYSGLVPPLSPCISHPSPALSRVFAS